MVLLHVRLVEFAASYQHFHGHVENGNCECVRIHIDCTAPAPAWIKTL